MDWDEMAGSESIRHCSKCRFNVYNFAEMTQEEVDTLLSSGDRVCGRLYLRPDGTYMTKNCRAKVNRKRALKIFAAVAILPLTFALFKNGKQNRDAYVNGLRDVPVAGSLVNFFFPETQPLMGEICIPVTPPPQPQIRTAANPGEELEDE
jgi:hypothetical protein